MAKVFVRKHNSPSRTPTTVRLLPAKQFSSVSRKYPNRLPAHDKANNFSYKAPIFSDKAPNFSSNRRNSPHHIDGEGNSYLNSPECAQRPKLSANYVFANYGVNPAAPHPAPVSVSSGDVCGDARGVVEEHVVG